MKSSGAGKRPRTDAAEGSTRQRGAAAVSVRVATPPSNTGVNSGVPQSEKRSKRGRFEAATLANDPGLREETGEFLRALDMVLCGFAGLEREAAKQGDYRIAEMYRAALAGAVGLRVALTVNAEAHGVRFHADEGIQALLRAAATSMQAAARMDLAKISGGDLVSHAKEPRVSL